MPSAELDTATPAPLSATLNRELIGLANAPRGEAVAALKALRVRELALIKQWQLEHLGELTGNDVCSAITALTDALVRHVVERAFARVDAPADWSNHVGVFAIGGYGRGEMNPGSDLDLLVLAATKTPQVWLAKGYAELQALLWDVKFQVGASQRNLAELERILQEDFVTGTAVIEQRPLLAGEVPQRELAALLERFRAKRTLPFLRYKLDELAKRRAQAGVSLFLMEPNLKTNPGCLRDVQLLRNIAFMVCGSRNLLSLTDLDAITRADLLGVAATNDHLLALRSLLHFHHGRKQDVFQLADQVRVAQQLGYADVSRLRAVEHFMKHHYALVLHVHQVVELTISRLRALGHLGRRPLLILSRRTLNDDFSSVESLVYLAKREFWTEPDAGVRLLSMCRQAQSRDLRLSIELQRTIKANLHVITDAVRHDRAVGKIFLELLGDAGRVHPILVDMHNAGLLGAYLPEFGNLLCLMQFDSYHQYTVDDHTLLAMKNLDAVAQGEPSLPNMGRIFPTIARKDLLALSLLLHDMGKYMGRGHVARGAIMVDQVAKRLGLTEAEEELVYFLVERHVSLSDASRMRNFHEAAFLAAFAERMGSVANLNALYCLTYCDAKAVGEGIMTGWQESILGELRDAVEGQLLADGSHHASRHERLMDAFKTAGIELSAATAFLGELTGTYPYQVVPAEAVRHFQVLERAKREGVAIIHELKDNIIFLTAAVSDRHGLFADVAATLTGHGFDIIDARTWIAQQGIVLYSYRLATIYPARIREPELWTRFLTDLRAVAVGTIDGQALLERRRNTVLVNKPADSGFEDPAVKTEQRTSDDFTIVDVHTKDQVGLLSRLCRAISAYGCDISYSSINTMGDVAVDVFYVSRAGKKLTDEDAEGLRQQLIGALGLVTTA